MSPASLTDPVAVMDGPLEKLWEMYGILQLHDFLVQIFHARIFLPEISFFLLGKSLEGQCMIFFFSGLLAVHEFLFVVVVVVVVVVWLTSHIMIKNNARKIGVYIVIVNVNVIVIAIAIAIAIAIVIVVFDFVAVALVVVVVVVVVIVIVIVIAIVVVIFRTSSVGNHSLLSPWKVYWGGWNRYQY